MTINLKVLDLSHHNQVNSFTMIADYGIKGVILKATQGTYMKDPTYPARYAAAKAAGLMVGAYHFPDSSSPEAQLNYFLDYAKLDPATDLGALDFEADTTHGRTMLLDQARDWLANFERRFGRKAVLYSGNLIKEQFHGEDPFLSAHKLWLPQYSSHPVLPPQWKSYFLWQYTDGTNHAAGGPTSVPGVTGLLDCNTYPGLDAELVRDWTS